MSQSNSQKIKELIKEAVDIVEELQLPQSFQPIAFKLVLDFLAGIEKNIILVEEKPESKTSKKDETDREIKSEEILAQKLGIEEPKLLYSVYEFYPDGEIGINVKLEGKNSDIQRKTAYLYLLPSQLLPNQEEWIFSSALNKQIAKNGKHLVDGHTSESLEKESGKILSRGKGKGRKYSLSSSGVKEAKSILNDIIERNR